MNLVIDIGNSLIKTGIFIDNQLKDVQKFSDINVFETFIKIGNYQNIALCSVGKTEWVDSLKKLISNLVFIDHKTPLPIDFNYDTPETLGVDRLVACVGAWHLWKNPCLVVDIGTCITLDVLDENGVFIGGNISPGPRLRFQSMHNFTASLPLEELNEESRLLGKSTREALQSGVKNGIINEIEGTYNSLIQKNPNFQLVLTGGYSNFFDNKLKASIFAEPNLVLIGLNAILEYNVKK